MSSKSGGRKKTLEENLIIADNRKANFQFEIEDMFEAGIVLTGSEIKSIRENRVNIKESYASAEKGEIFLILEALAQASGLLVFKTPKLCPPNESLYLFVGIDKARFKRQVIPGDQIILEVIMTKNKQGFAIFSATATVDSEVAASAELMCGFKELPKKL